MAFEPHDFHDLIRLLREHPDWREELRALLLTQELLTLPGLVRELADTAARLVEGQQQQVQRLDRLTETVAQLATHLDQLTTRVDQLTVRQEQLTETVTQLTARLEQLTARVDELTVRLEQLTARVDQLAEMVAQLTVRLEQLTARVDELTVRLEQLTARVDQLAETVAQLTVRLEQLTARVDELTVRLEQLTARVDQLTETVALLAAGQERLVVQMGEVRGWALEQRYHTQAPAYFGRFLQRVRPADAGRLADTLRARLAEEDLAEVLLTDLILTGRLATPRGPQTVWVVLEVSATVDRGDVERAQRRAALLRQARYPAVAVAAGVEATAGARQVARDAGVALLLDGRIDGWQEALEHALSNGAGEPRSP
jgi:uncharacterized protein YoxC